MGFLPIIGGLLASTLFKGGGLGGSFGLNDVGLTALMASGQRLAETSIDMQAKTMDYQSQLTAQVGSAVKDYLAKNMDVGIMALHQKYKVQALSTYAKVANLWIDAAGRFAS